MLIRVAGEGRDELERCTRQQVELFLAAALDADAARHARAVNRQLAAGDDCRTAGAPDRVAQPAGIVDPENSLPRAGASVSSPSPFSAT